MQKLFIITFALFVAVNFCEEPGFLPNLESSKTSYDHYVFAQQWGPTMCHDGCPRDARKRMDVLRGFSLHGLWPSSGTAFGPFECRRDRFDENALSDEIHAGMESAWFSFKKSHTNVSFWTHEWEKHGTCARNFPGMSGAVTEDQYFGTALKLRERYNLLDALVAEGIKPSNDTPYYGEDIADAFRKHYGHRIGLSGSHHRGGQYNLLQIYMCLDLDFEVIDCDKEWHDHTFENKDVYIPEFDDVESHQNYNLQMVGQ